MFTAEALESVIMYEVADKSMTQKDVAQSYSLAMDSGESIDWAKVNAAIVTRWSVSGLNRVKNMAWSGRCWND